MQGVFQPTCEVEHEVEREVEHEAQPVEPPLCEFDLMGADAPLSRPARVIASVGAWLVERFANVPGPVFIEDGRLAAYSRELQAPAFEPETSDKVIH
jgi:hypothetical protein